MAGIEQSGFIGYGADGYPHTPAQPTHAEANWLAVGTNDYTGYTIETYGVERGTTGPYDAVNGCADPVVDAHMWGPPFIK